MTRPTPTPASPYAPRHPTPDEHDWYADLAEYAADASASALAIGEMRRGMAHRYLAAAHLAAILDGAGPDVLADFMNAVAHDLGVARG